MKNETTPSAANKKREKEVITSRLPDICDCGSFEQSLNTHFAKLHYIIFSNVE